MALLWGGLSFSAVGDQLYAVALTWIAVGVLGSNAGYLGAVQAFISPAIGAAVDARGYGPVCLAGSLMPLAAVAILKWTGSRR